ncbi:hypothetical protein C8R44DRAFT_862465 [Mycena epipterygia]|nr:hypothetical protein C8R44DRAFT_862465 [Mycena epipterygia]
MERCLQITEVLQVICDHMSRRNLVSLSRTCRALRDPALDSIWHTQTSLVPLLKCLPPHIWQEISECKRRVLSIRHPITPDDWRRVQMYSYRVKNLAIEGAELDADFFRALEISIPGSFLLPNLRSLSWTVEDAGIFPFCRLLLPPTLVSVNVVLQDCTPDLSLFSTLRISHPHLTDIHVDVPTSSSSIHIVSNAICGWKFIKKLTVTTLDELALVHIAGLPALEDLQLQSYIPPVSAQRLSTLIPVHAFPKLRLLEIHADTIISAFSLIARIASVQLEELHITTTRCAPSSVWKAAFLALARLPSSQHLTSLSLCQRTNSSPIPADVIDRYILGPETVAPLLRLVNLINLSLQPFFGLDLDDETIHQMAAAWPYLETLELGGERAMPRPPRATLRCLIYLAEHCVNLNSLQIAVDATDPVPRLSRPRKTKPRNALTYLNTGPSPITSPALVAAFLSNNFAAIAFGRRSDTDADRPWNEVSHLFQVFRSVRAAEARCWSSEDSGSDGWSSEQETLDEENSDDELALPLFSLDQL